ncbi:hypothetical protein M406DRAFT_71941 [Cryphonectria parasitica EP155]|uniref:F-box domain-containing protein n=1 Tax=Cryphonectria parasitica (strain ATCC 38755 / EP155) TaxID=660469 RepID=A0A9P4Y9I4_CRYP1|nr:uncharacterized protein M406DRAFT_71941 [Cryphonectria parasitica EP155]KAF3768983.1 hypothetical protein M406DRAFT_71941 [Cryphonectria parasitica EP155]
MAHTAGHRVSQDLLLEIAEHCDLKTLSSLMQTCKHVYLIINSYKQSIAKAKIATYISPPTGLVLTSRDEKRCVIPLRNSLHTVRELQRREDRVDSILDRGGFMLTDRPDTLGLGSLASLEKFKAGLRDALYITDQIADLAAHPSLDQAGGVSDVKARAWHTMSDSTTDVRSTGVNTLSAYNARLALHFRKMRQLRQLQIDLLRSLPTRLLCWLLTLAAGGSKGYARYCMRLLESDPGMGHARVMAFKEVLLRGGGFILWGFLRGRGPLHSFVKAAIWACTEEVMFFEWSGGWGWGAVGEDEARAPDGLHMTIMDELRQRFVEAKREQIAENKNRNGEEEWDETTWGANDTLEEVHRIVGEEVECKSWKGYAAVEHDIKG